MKISSAGIMGLIIVIAAYITGSLLAISANKQFIAGQGMGQYPVYWAESALQYRIAQDIAAGKTVYGVQKKAQYPEGLNITTELTTAMEWVTGHLYRLISLVRPGLTFRTYSMYFLGFFSGLSILVIYGVAGMVWESRLSGIVAACLYAVSLARIERLIGNFGLEVFAMPWIFFGILLFLKAMEKGEAKKAQYYSLGAGISWAMALLTWHFSQFAFLIFSASLWWTAIKSDNESTAWRAKQAAYMLLPVILAGVLSPVLVKKSFLISSGMINGYMVVIFLIARSRGMVGNMTFVKIASILALCAGIVAVSGVLMPGRKDFMHVYALAMDKIHFLGKKPLDSLLLRPDSRLVWTYVTATPDLYSWLYRFGTLLPPAVAAALIWLATKGRPAVAMMCLWFVVFIALFAMVERLSVFLAFFAVVMAAGLVSFPKRQAARYAIVLLAVCLVFFEGNRVWAYPTLTAAYDTRLLQQCKKDTAPAVPQMQGTDVALFDWLRQNTAGASVVLADIGLSPQIYGNIDRAVVLQPKFESAFMREKYRGFLGALYGNESDGYAYCRRYGVNYFVYQANFALDNSAYSPRDMAGRRLLAKDSLAFTCHFEPEKLQHFMMVYQNSFFRVYKVLAEGERVQEMSVPSDNPLFSLQMFNQDPRHLYFDDSKTPAVIALYLAMGAR